MDNHVVVTLCRALAEEGATTLRFNFRRAGAAEEAFDLFSAALADAEAAATALRGAAPYAPTLLVAGYSFGAAVAVGVSSRVGASAVVLVSLPAQADASLPDVPTLIVTGELDEIAPPAPLLRLRAPSREVAVVEGADHFWGAGSERLASAVRSFAGNLQAEQ
jgi:alpha/beta superfamily hydrolase